MSNNEQPNLTNRQIGQQNRRAREQAEHSLPPSSAVSNNEQPNLTNRQIGQQNRRAREQAERSLPPSSAVSNNEQSNLSNRQIGQQNRRAREQAERSLPPSSAGGTSDLGLDTLIPPALNARQLIRRGKRPMVEQTDCSLPSSCHTIRADSRPSTSIPSAVDAPQEAQAACCVPQSSDIGPDTFIPPPVDERSVPQSSDIGRPDTLILHVVESRELPHLSRTPRGQPAITGSETVQMVHHPTDLPKKKKKRRQRQAENIVSVSIFGEVDQDLSLAVELLRRHNVHVQIQTERHYNVIRINEETNRSSTGSEANNWMQVYDDLERINTSTLCDWRRPNQIIVHAPNWTHWKYVRIDTWAFLKIMRRRFGW